MSKMTLGKRYRNSSTPERLEKLEAKILDLLFNVGHTVNKDLVEDIAIIVYQHEDMAFYKKDYGKL